MSKTFYQLMLCAFVGFSAVTFYTSWRNAQIAEAWQYRSLNGMGYCAKPDKRPVIRRRPTEFWIATDKPMKRGTQVWE